MRWMDPDTDELWELSIRGMVNYEMDELGDVCVRRILTYDIDDV